MKFLFPYTEFVHMWFAVWSIREKKWMCEILNCLCSAAYAAPAPYHHISSYNRAINTLHIYNLQNTPECVCVYVCTTSELDVNLTEVIFQINWCGCSIMNDIIIRGVCAHNNSTIFVYMKKKNYVYVCLCAQVKSCSQSARLNCLP